MTDDAFRTIRRTLAFYARGEDEQRAQVLLDDIQGSVTALRDALERERTKRGIAFSFIPEQRHEEYADRLMIVDGQTLADCKGSSPSLVGLDGRVLTLTMSRVIQTPLGQFRKVGGPTVPFLDRWLFECPGCGQWAYLDRDQWHGRVSVDHAADGCTGGYHETHDYFAALEAACNLPDLTGDPNFDPKGDDELSV